MELFDNYGNIGRPIYDEYINAITGNVNTLQSTVTNSSTTTKTSSWELMINTHFYRNHSGGSMTWTSSTSSTVGKDVTISINPVSTDYFSMMERDRPIYYYGLQAYCLNDPNNGATREYYDDLIRREIMDNTFHHSMESGQHRRGDYHESAHVGYRHCRGKWIQLLR